jgi:hypothetical protein
MPTITDFKRVHILYTDDKGDQHAISQRRAAQVAIGNVVTTNDALPGRPDKWKLRHVLAKSVDGSNNIFHKKIVIGSVTNPFWTGASTSFVEDGATWTVQGRIGERRQVS